MIPCGKSELALFDAIPVQTSILSASFSDYYPISDTKSNRAPIEFYIPASQDEYIDLNDTSLYLSCRVLNTDGSVLTQEVDICTTNFFMHSLFKDVSLSLNDIVVEGGDNLYQYRAVMNSLLLFDEETRATQLEALGYAKDTGTGINKTRKEWISLSKTIELMGPLHLDMTNQPKYLLPNVSVRFKLTREEVEFSLYALADLKKKVQIVIDQAVLYVRRVRVQPGVNEGHEIGLNSQNAIYPLQHMKLTTFSIARGQQSMNKENCFHGKMPKLVIIALVSNSAMNGNLKKNPFNFTDFNLNHIGLYREGESIPHKHPLQMDVGNNVIIRAYMGTLQALELYNRNENNGMSINDFKNGKMLFAFNLTPDLTTGQGCTQPHRNGNLRLDLKFKQPLNETINVIMYGIFDATLEITKLRNILVDYR